MNTVLTAGTALLEQTMRHYLRLDAEALKRLAALHGKVLKIELRDWNAAFYVFPSAQGIDLQNCYEGAIDASLKGSPLSLLRLGLASDKNSILASSDIEFTGDMEVLQEFSRILQEIDVDWEELLARGVGDIFAHQVGNAVRGLQRWRKTAWSNFRRNLGDYLQEEAQQLPPQQEVEDFFTDVYTLHHDVERFERSLRQQQAKSL